MQRRTVLWVLAYVAATAVFVAGVVVLVRGRGDDGESASTGDVGPLADMPFQTHIAAPVTTSGTVGSQIPISVASHGEAEVASVTLFDGATVVARTAPTYDPSRVEMTFPALSVGPHLLYAEVVDVDGEAARTAPVPVEIAAAPESPAATEAPAGDDERETTVGVGPGEVGVPVEPLEDETPVQLGERLSLDPSKVLVTQPLSPSDVPIEQDVAIPPDAVVTVVVPRDGGLDALDAAKPVVVKAPRSIAKGPSLDATVEESEDCGTTLRNTGDGEVTVYGQDAGSAGWDEIGTIGAGKGLNLADLGPGNHTYFARGDGGDGAPVGVRAPMRCGERLGWSGDVSIVDGVITSPGGRPVWLYLSVDGQPWQRVPAGQEEYLSLKEVDSIAQHLPALHGRTLTVEMWQWGEFPKKIGAGKLVVPKGVALSDVVGDPSAVTLKQTTSADTLHDLQSSDQQLSFEWKAASPQVDEVLWQVLSKSPLLGDTDLNPPSLIGAGIAKRTSTTADGQGVGTFTIDTKDIARADVGDGTKGSAPLTGLGSSTAVLTPITDGTIRSVGKGTFVKVAVDDGAKDKIDAYLALPSPGDPVWIRVVTNPNGPGAPSASSTSSVMLPTPQTTEGGQIDFTVDSATADLGRAPNPAMFGCVDVAVPWPNEAPGLYSSGSGYWAGLKTLDPSTGQIYGPPDYALANQASASHFYPTSGTYCPSDFPPPADCDTWYCAFWDGVADLGEAFAEVVGTFYDLAAYMYNTAVDELVWTIGELNLGCKALGATAEEYCKEGSRWIGRAAVTVVLAYFGLPARLPDRKAAEGIAEGELAGVAVEVMKYYGVPCDTMKSDPEMVEALKKLAQEGGVDDSGDLVAEAAKDPCLALARAAISFVKQQVQATAEQSTAAATGMPYFGLIDGFEFRPNAESLPVPGTFSVTAHPTHSDADATGAQCLVELRDPASTLGKGPGPYPWTKFVLDEQAPIDGTGTWSGSVDLAPSADPVAVASLRGLPIQAEFRSHQPNVCIFDAAVATGTLAAPAAVGG